MSKEPPDTDKIKRLWTVLIYMAGDNNLSEECVYALTEAKESLIENDKPLAVLAQFDPSGVRTETRRYRLRSRRFTLREDADITGWKARETDTGEPHNLLEFIRWGFAHYPAEHFAVILVGHGSGTDDDFLLQDENPPNSLNILELRYVFEQLEQDQRVVDILGFDTCLMNMAEVCYELKFSSIKYLVGSEGFAPNTGWPYKEILEILREKINSDPSGATPNWLAEQIVEEYTRFYVPYINGGISVDQSALEVRLIDEVKERMFTLCGALLDEIEHHKLDYGTPKNNALVLAHWDAQSYNGEAFVDLHDFCDRLIFRYKQLVEYCKVDDSEVERIIGLCGRVNDAIDDLVIRSCVAGAAFQFSYGVSIYFPWAVLSPKYANLAFGKESRWLNFLRKYHEITRRRSRRCVGPPPDKTPFDFPEPPEPFRASVPQNKGRNGRVESMRNPPADEFVGCLTEPKHTTSHIKPPPSDPKAPEQPTERPGTTEAATSPSRQSSGSANANKSRTKK